MWLWAINNADKDGFIAGADKEDLEDVISIGLDKRYSASGVVEAMISTGWVDDEDGLYIHDWTEWQKYWYKALEVREKAADRKRKERARKKLEKEDAPLQGKEMEEVLLVPELIVPQKELQKQPPDVSYSSSFEKMWEIYPRKIGKGEAYKKYKARLNDGWSEDELFEAVKKYANKVSKEKTEQKYIKHAKTFFSESTPFTDYLPKKMEDVNEKKADDENPYADWR